jgi:hypothetical protein
VKFSYSVTSTLRQIKHITVNQKLSQSIFFTPTNDDEITAINKGLKNKKSGRLDEFSSSLTKKSNFLIKKSFYSVEEFMTVDSQLVNHE